MSRTTRACVALAWAAVVLGAPSAPPKIEAAATYPKRSSDDSALLEWGSSAIIHNADGVVAKFGPGATHPEFELGIEANLVTATPRQGCEALTNGRDAETQIVVASCGNELHGRAGTASSRIGSASLRVRST